MRVSAHSAGGYTEGSQAQANHGGGGAPLSGSEIGKMKARCDSVLGGARRLVDTNGQKPVHTHTHRDKVKVKPPISAQGHCSMR